MRRFILIFVLTLILLSGLAYSEPLSRVRFDPWCLTIQSGDIRLEHYKLRDHYAVNCGSTSATAIDFDCNGLLDIVMIGGKPVSHDSCEFIELEVRIAEWKEEVNYKMHVELWEKWKEENKKGGVR